MRYLLDTNIISELRKGAQCDSRVSGWFASVADHDLFLSVLVLGEIRKGVERLRRDDPARVRVLEDWMRTVQEAYSDRILSVDLSVAEEWGRMSAGRTVSTVDALLAATAKVHGITLVTRNVADVVDLGAEILNPFESSR